MDLAGRKGLPIGVADLQRVVLGNQITKVAGYGMVVCRQQCGVMRRVWKR